MSRTIAAITTAALAAGVVTAVPALVATPAMPSQAEASVARAVETECPQHGWPYYDTKCLRGDAHREQRVSTVKAQLVRDVPTRVVRIVR